MTAVETLTYPDPDNALDLASRNADRGALVTLVGPCTVEYEGRAASSLGLGDRHVMLKPDGAALVHTDEGQQPVNWQPPGCDHEVTVDDGSLVVQSTRSTPEESLEVVFETVAHAAAFDVNDSEDLALTGTESDLKDRILDDPALVETGFTPLATERETPAGAVDIYGEDTDGRTTILELKRRRVGPDAVGQLDRYVEALDRDLHADTEVRGVLIAPSVTDRARQLLAEKGLEFVSLEPPS
ncbi:MAG: endonuclease NucS [Haloarcula sp.]